MAFNRFLSRLPIHYKSAVKLNEMTEKHMILTGKILSEKYKYSSFESPGDVEFSVFSQFGDDGIIQWLINNIEFSNKKFIEFGVEDYVESNTRFLLMNNNWSGLVIDGSASNISKIKNSYYYGKYDLEAKKEFITAENINDVLSKSGIGKSVGILHIDIDGNDYWVWKSISSIDAELVIIEYNSIFGADRAITTPYRIDFVRSKAHYSNLYAGASLPALYLLANQKGYAFIGSNSSGNNAYFIKREKLSSKLREANLSSGYVLSKFRESRDINGNHTFISGSERIKQISGMPVVNVKTNEIESI